MRPRTFPSLSTLITPGGSWGIMYSTFEGCIDFLSAFQFSPVYSEIVFSTCYKIVCELRTHSLQINHVDICIVGENYVVSILLVLEMRIGPKSCIPPSHGLFFSCKVNFGNSRSMSLPRNVKAARELHGELILVV